MMTRTDILGLLTELLVEEVSLTELNEGQSAIEAYPALMADITAVDAELDDILPDLISDYYEKKHGLEREAKQKVYDANLKVKEAIIEELRILIQDEENIGKAFSTFNEIRDRWNDTGDIPRAQFQRMHTEYSRLQETFYYNISIYKELADHDKRINLKKKEELVEKVKALHKEKSITKADSELKLLLRTWDDVGGTFPGDWERVKNEFWTEARTVMSRVDAHYEGIRSQQSENLEKKKQLIQQVSDMASKERAKRKEWNDATEKVLGLQKDWKKIGFSADNERTWKEFRAACDGFFTAKQAFYDQINAQYDDKKVKKEALIQRAKELATSENWKDTSKAIIDLQNQWKEVGSASQRDENRLWKEFRGHCDSFFNARNRNFKQRNSEEKENLTVKEDIIERVKAFAMSGNRNADMQQLRDFGNEWNEIGHVPFKKKDEVYTAYREAIGKHYDSIKMDERERKSMMLNQKVERIKSDPSSINSEKSHIRRQIDKIKQENLQYENNMGFINTRGGTNPLVQEVERKMKRNQVRIKELIQMLKMLDSGQA